MAFPGLMGGGPPPAAGPPMMGGPMGDAELPPGEQSESPGAILREMLDAARRFLDVAASEQDALIMEKITTLLQNALATEEKDRESALGMSGKLKAMARGTY